MTTVDGSFGEGGGQILRTSLALSLVTGKPFRIHNIRSARKKPGLMRQHLTAVHAAVAVGNAAAMGTGIGSQDLEFAPTTINAGEHHFAVGTAGSAILVLQTVLPALVIAEKPSQLTLEGGTHNPFAPPFDFLERVYLPLINRMGPTVTAMLERPGFYPAGGGRFTVTIEPVKTLQPIDLLERGKIVSRKAKALVARLPKSINDRELGIIHEQLKWDKRFLESQSVPESRGPGNAVMIEIESTHITELFTAFGKKGLPAEKVPLPIIKEVREYLNANVPVGRHLADQLMIPMAMAGSGSFATLPLSLHSKTNMEVIKKFLNVEITVVEVEDEVRAVRFKTPRG